MRSFAALLTTVVLVLALSVPLLAGVGGERPVDPPTPTKTPTKTPTHTPTPTQTPTVTPTPPPPPPPPPPPKYITEKKVVYHYTNEVHRVVTGYAKRKLAPNFLDNDWDSAKGYESKKKLLKILTSAEEKYLKTVKNLKNKVKYYIDMTSKVVQTRNFKDSSKETGRKTTSVVTKSKENGRDVIKTTETTHIYVTKVDYQIVAEVYDYSPLVLDLNQDGRLDVADNEWRPHSPKFYAEYAKWFDITGDGQKDFTEWVSAGVRDGILVRPDNGKVEGALQLFGTAGGYADGFEKLTLVQDSNRNGWIEGAELEGLFVWIDDNNDSECQAAELRTLDEFGVKRLSTRHQDYVGSYQTADGKTHKMWDWWPAALETRKFHAP